MVRKHPDTFGSVLSGFQLPTPIRDTSRACPEPESQLCSGFGALQNGAQLLQSALLYVFFVSLDTVYIYFKVAS